MLLEKSGCTREATSSYSIETNIGKFENFALIINYNFSKIKILFNFSLMYPHMITDNYLHDTEDIP